MTLGQLFRIMYPEVKIRENGTCIWLFFGEANYYTIATEWWYQEIPDNVISMLKEQESVSPIAKKEMDEITSCLETVYYCGNCHAYLPLYKEYNVFCPKCGRKIKWND